MIQLLKDLFITNNSLNKTPKEANSSGTRNPEKDFASIFRTEDGHAEAKSDFSENVCNEGAVYTADNSFEKENKVVINKNGEFYNINLQSLIVTDNGNTDTEASDAEVEFDEAVTSDENENLIYAKAYSYAFNLGLENVKENITSGINTNAEDKPLPEIIRNFEPLPKLNSDHMAFPPEDDAADIDDIDNLLSDNEKYDYASKMKEAEGNQNLKTGETSGNLNLKTSEISENLNSKTSEVLENQSLISGEVSGNQNIKTSEVLESQSLKTGEASGNQNSAIVNKTDTKEHKKSDAANTLYPADDILEKKGSSLPADNVQIKTEIKETGEPVNKADFVPGKAEAHKSSGEDNANDEGKSDHKRQDKSFQVKGLEKEADVFADRDLDKDMTINRTGFHDFMQKISEERSMVNNSSPKPQQMELASRGPSAFSESVGNVIRFINTGGLTKATIIIDPPALGKVNIEIISTDNGIETILKVSNEQVKLLVQDQIIQLKQNLEQIGVNLAEFTVDIQQDNNSSRDQSNNKPQKVRLGAVEEEESEAERIEAFRVDLRKGLLHWIA